MSLPAIQFVRAKHYTHANRGLADITLVVIHTAECREHDRAAENVAAYFAGDNAPNASAHYTVDADSTTQSVLEKDIAWHAGPVNRYSIGVEHAGYARQSSSEWKDDYSRSMLERSAQLVGNICRRYSIPVIRLEAEDLRVDHRSGLCGHADVTMGLTGGKGHWDPGPDFPWEWYLAKVAAASSLPSIPVDVFTVRGQQIRLAELGFDPGPIDGILGPKTIATIKAFQTSCNLVPDGIVGPKTQTALALR